MGSTGEVGLSPSLAAAGADLALKPGVDGCSPGTGFTVSAESLVKC